MKKFQNVNRYEDMIHLPHHVSEHRARMPIADRAAQFSPFAALTGYDDAVRETARLTQEWIEQDESEKSHLDRQLRFIKEHIKEAPEIEVTYFVPDEKKTGGKYITVTGTVKKLNEYERYIMMGGGTCIPIDRIHDLSVL